MADDLQRRPASPSNWHNAFAALPSVLPPSDAWARVAAALPPATAAPRHARRRRPMVWAAAAALMMAAGASAWMQQRADDAEVAPTTVASRAGDAQGASRRPLDASRTAEPASGAVHIARGGVPSTGAAASLAAGGAITSASPSARAVAIATPQQGAQHLARTHANDSRSTRAIAHAASTSRDVGSTPSAAAVTPAPTPTGRSLTSTSSTPPEPSRASTPATPLDALRAESARLESLVALVRDERVQSAPAAMLAADVDDRLRLIDAALSQPGLADAERLDLWSRRVAALRELAGLEGTRRWLAVHGESYEDAIARVD